MAHAGLLASHWNQVLKQKASIKAKREKLATNPYDVGFLARCKFLHLCSARTGLRWMGCHV
jgi:hypothetical protein